MEQLRKVVAIGCLTYVVYGLISWFQLGIFLPPLPVKPFLFLGFTIFGLVNAFQSSFKFIDLIFFSWLILISCINQNFLELVFSTESIINFQEYAEVYFLLLAVVLFTFFNALIILKLKDAKSIFNLYFLILGILIGGVFIYPEYIGLEESSIIFGVLYFLHDRFMNYDFEMSIRRIMVLLPGIALIEFVEWIVLI